MKIERIKEDREVFAKSENITIYKVTDESNKKNLLDREQQPEG